MVVEVAADELDRLHGLIAGRFARSEPRARVRRYVFGLVAGLERKNGWTLAEEAGGIVPDGMRRLLRRSDWDLDEVRDDVHGYVIAHLGDPGGALIAMRPPSSINVAGGEQDADRIGGMTRVPRVLKKEQRGKHL